MCDIFFKFLPVQSVVFDDALLRAITRTPTLFGFLEAQAMKDLSASHTSTAETQYLRILTLISTISENSSLGYFERERGSNPSFQDSWRRKNSFNVSD